MKKALIMCLLLFASAAAFGQIYPDETSSPTKPGWVEGTKMPKVKKHYYLDKGFGQGLTYEEARENAIAQIKENRSLTTGQQVVISSTNKDAVKEVEDRLTVKAQVVDEYWVKYFDSHKQTNVYRFYVLCRLPKYM